jgi:proteasome lid subunit RPN8/RPN11
VSRAEAGPESHVWIAAGARRRIESSLAVLEEIRAAAVEGFYRFPRGGLEVGGILFGGVEGGLVRILAARPLECEHLFGPSFALSPSDGKRLSEALAAAPTDPGLAGLQAVGWYHSHTRSEVYLAESDLEIYRKYFPEPWQVALVVRPEPLGTTRAGFFLREEDGSVRAERSDAEFVIELQAPRARRSAPERAEPPVPARRAAVAFPPPQPEPAPPPQPEPEPAPREQTARPRRRFRLALVLLVALLVVLAGAGIVLLRRPAQPTRPLSLRVLDSGGQLRITWDRNSPSLRQARAAGLDITDGDRRMRVPFTAARLRQGGVSYTRQSENVEVRLWVEPGGGGGIQEEYVRFLGGLAQPPPAPEPAAGPAVPPVLSARPAKPSVPPAGPAKPPVPPPARTSPPPKAFNLARLPRPVAGAAANPVLPAPPLVVSSDLRAGPAPGLSARSEAPPPPEPAPPAPPSPAYLGPRSGRIIWTGQLATGGALSLDGQHASAGILSATLPGVPVHVSVHPAELTARGLVVYTAAARSVRESPGPQNGWNETTYAREPRRAAAVLVIESPSAQGGWKHLAVRNDGPAVSVIVIDWNVSE